MALMLAAQARGAEIFITTPSDLCGGPYGVDAHARKIQVEDRADWWQAQEMASVALTDFDVVLMRKDPPVDMAYITATWLLDQVRAAGVCVLNAPEALRSVNEKPVHRAIRRLGSASAGERAAGRSGGFFGGVQ